MESLPMLHHTEKKEQFLSTSQLQSCFHETAKQTGKHHTQYATLLPTPQENNPV
jgi:hypothetical protein